MIFVSFTPAICQCVRDGSGSLLQGCLIVLWQVAATAGSPRTARKTTEQHKTATSGQPARTPPKKLT